MYSPLTFDPGLGRHNLSKVQRWGLFLARFEYIIEHVDSEKNIIADMMTRWFKGYRSKRSIVVRYIREIL